MEILLLLPLLLSIFYLFHALSKAKVSRDKKRRAPQASGAWPIIGHLHILGRSDQLPHKTLATLADKYGPVFTIKLGAHTALVVSDSESAKECLTTNDRVFANRPRSVCSEVAGYNYAMIGFSPYGPYWRQVKKTATLELLSSRRLEMLGPIRVSEVKSSIRDLYTAWVTRVDDASSEMVKCEMKPWLGSLVLNVVVRMISGKRFPPDDEEGIRFQEVTRKFFELSGAFVVPDAVPYTRWLDIGGYEKEMKKTAEDLDNFFQGWLKDRKENKRINTTTMDADRHQAFMDVMISILENSSPDDFPGYDHDTIIKATCLAILVAGTDTTTVTLTWALSLLLNNPDALEKARHELELHVGRERPVEESDMKNLVYLHAIIKETLRLYPAGPLSVPHESMDECQVGGYDIPKGTRLLVNLWKIHRDPRAWPDPHKFRPERFLTTHKEVDVRGQHFNLIPFGSGRRMCPGISLSLQSMELTLASLIQAFDLRRPSDEHIDMTESFGLTIMKATPLDVLLKPRLSPDAVAMISVRRETQAIVSVNGKRTDRSRYLYSNLFLPERSNQEPNPNPRLLEPPRMPDYGRSKYV